MEKRKTLRINRNESGSDSDKKGKINLKLKNGGSSSDSGEDEEYLDVVNDPYSPVHHQDQVKMAQKARVSVSAEVFGKYHSKAAFTSKVVKKSKEI